jgi:HEAT repeat protein
MSNDSSPPTDKHSAARELGRNLTLPASAFTENTIHDVIGLFSRIKQQGPSQVVLSLTELLSDPVPATRFGAAIKLLQMGEERTMAASVFSEFLNGTDIELQMQAATMLGIIGVCPDEVKDDLIRIFRDDDWKLKVAAAASLRELPESIGILEQALFGDDTNLTVIAANGLILRKLRISEATTILSRKLGNAPSQLRIGIISILSRAIPYNVDVITLFLGLLNNPATEPAVKTAILCNLGKYGKQIEMRDDLANSMLDALRSGEWETICAAAAAISELVTIPPIVFQVLSHLISSPNDNARGTAAWLLGGFGSRSSDAIPVLLEQLKRETEIKVLHALVNAIRLIGLPNIQDDPHFYDATIDSFVEQAKAEKNHELLQYRLYVFCLFQERALSALIRLAQSNDLMSEVAAMNSLAMIGMTSTDAGDAVIGEITNQLMAHQKARVRMIGAGTLSLLGRNAAKATPTLVKLLEDEDTEVYGDVLNALRAIGPDAREAAPVVSRLLLGKDLFQSSLARDVLLAIGPDALPSLETVYSVANSEEKPRVESLRSVLKAIADQQSNADARQRLEMLVPKALRVEENIKTLKVFYKIGCAYEKQGAKSKRKVSMILSGEMTYPTCDKYFTSVQTLLEPIGVLFQRSFVGNQERISGLTEAGRMAWQLVGEIFKDVEL